MLSRIVPFQVKQLRPISGATRVRNGFIVLSLVFVVSVLAFKLTGEYDWVQATWMTVITISSVGYGEFPQSSVATQVTSIAVILVGMTAAAYTFGGVLRMMFEGELDKALGRHRLSRELSRLTEHVVICGFGRIGQELCESLAAVGEEFVVVDVDPDRIEFAIEQGYMGYQGDATADEVLDLVGVRRARVLVSALPNDAQNVFITLTARNLNAELLVIARAERRETESKLRQAGANRIVTPAITGAQQMNRMITRPSTADLIELVSETSALDFELDEILVTDQSRVVGKRASEIDAFVERKLLLVAVKPPDGKIAFNPTGNREFASGDVLIILGHGDEISKLRSKEKLE